MHALHLASETDWEGFRRLARPHLLAGTPPTDLVWQTPAKRHGELFSEPSCEADETISETPAASGVRVNRAFLALAQLAFLHRDPARFELLYRALLRMQHEPGLAQDTIDPDIMQIHGMARTVRRDMHKMKAFVRFRPIADDRGQTVHVSWFEPEHFIVEATAPFFRDRFTQMAWAIMTPLRSARWDGHALHFGPGASKQDCPGADAGETLWLTYYRHIFNPARLKLNMMQKEMPRRYWHNLPEAALIGELASEAQARSGHMLAADATEPRKRVVRIAPIDRQPAAAPLSHEAPRDSAQARIAHLAHLRDCAQACRQCPIGEHATQAVWGEGPVDANLMIVGEQPGDIEDLRGRPFVGPSGQLFDRAVADLGWDRRQLYVTNAVKHFKFEPRGKRRIHKTPAQQEAAACLDWLDQEIANVRPQRIVALGATAARALLGRQVVLKQVRGQWLPGIHGTEVLSTWHPSALLRMDPPQQREAYADWLRDLALAAPV